MHFEPTSVLRLSVTYALFVLTAFSVCAARRVTLRPLSPEEVLTVLKLAGREDAVPEGRVVTQGLAAISGFVLGLKKGVGGSFLLDLAKSNATSDFLSNFDATAFLNDFQGINVTALIQKFKLDSPNNFSPVRYKTTEICFETRNSDASFEQIKRQPTLLVSGTYETDTSGAWSGAAHENDSGFNSDAHTITQADSGGDQTCIVLQKPVLRKRRSSHRMGRLSS